MGFSDASLVGSSDKKSFNDQYILGRELGRGAFAHVRVAVSVVGGRASTVVSTSEKDDHVAKIVYLQTDHKGRARPLSSCGPQKTCHRKSKVAGMESKVVGMGQTLWKIIGNVAGSAAGGKAAHAVNTTERAELAVKILDLRTDHKGQTRPLSSFGPQETSRRKRKSARMEETLWRIIGNHNNCVRLHKVFFEPTVCYMVMERCNFSLRHYLEQTSDLTERSLGHIFHQMLQGIAHIHSVDIVHRDVKPSNFMVGGDDGQTVKLGDFGLSTSLLASDETRAVCGTVPFMSPEMFTGKYDEKTDVWSLGVVAYALLFGEFPYMPSRETHALFKKTILMGHPPAFAPKNHNARACLVDDDKLRTDSAVKFVKTLLQRSPALRPSAQESLATTYIHEIGLGCHAHGVELPSLRSALLSAKQVGAFGTCSCDDAEIKKLPVEPEKSGQSFPVAMPAESPSCGQIEIGVEKDAHLATHYDADVCAPAPDEVGGLSANSTGCSIGDDDALHSLDAESLQSNPVHPDVGHLSDTDIPRTPQFGLQNFDQSQKLVAEFLVPSALKATTDVMDPLLPKTLRKLPSQMD